MRTAAILPVKRFERAKQRLGASVADGLRLALAAAMVDDVLAALARARAIERTIVVTRERAVHAPARGHGALVIEDEREKGQSAAAALGVREALAQGFQRVLCVPGDCPALDPRELDALLDGHRDAAQPSGVVIVPDRHGTGTNGLLLCPPQAIPASFGPDSCERHLALARAAGVSCRVERVPSLLLDVDTGADLDALRERLGRLAGGAARTQAVLADPQNHPPPHIPSLTTPACVSVPPHGVSP